MLNLHVGEVSPSLVPPEGVVDHDGAVRHWSVPGDRGPVGLVQVIDVVPEHPQLRRRDQDHEQGGRVAAELLGVGEGPDDGGEGGGLLR